MRFFGPDVVFIPTAEREGVCVGLPALELELDVAAMQPRSPIAA
jgi:hypothetical protein